MKSSMVQKFVNLGLVGLLAAMGTQACAKKEETKAETSASDGGGGGDTRPTLSGAYQSTCVAIPGMSIGGATHKLSRLSFGGNSASDFENAVYFASDASCTTFTYIGVQTGSFAVGNRPGTLDPYPISFAIGNTGVRAFDWTKECYNLRVGRGAPSFFSSSFLSSNSFGDT